MAEDTYRRQAMPRLIPGMPNDEDDDYIPSWSSRNKAMRALTQGVPQRSLGEEITGFDPEQARRIFSQVRRPFDPREERPEFMGNIIKTMEYRGEREGADYPSVVGQELNNSENVRRMQQSFLDAGASNNGGVGNIAIEKSAEASPPKMSLSDKAIDFIGEIEGFEPNPYRVHPSDPLTIGYGHVIQSSEDFSRGITREEAKALKLKDIQQRVDEVNDWAKEHNVKLTQQQFDALVSFHYNTGSIHKMEELKDLIVGGSATPDKIRAAFGEYYTSDGKRMFGLWRRRMNEADMYLHGDYRNKNWNVPENIEFDPD